jgi:uncharacterized membrane protein
LGWAFETIYVYTQSGRFYNQGFMRLPFCPIYGCSVMVVYWLLGVPRKGTDERCVLVKRLKTPWGQGIAYVLFAFLVPSVAELLVGAFFDRLFSLRLWSYHAYPMHINGYVCLPVSMAWGVLLFVCMRFFFLPLKKLVGIFPKPIAFVLATILMLCVCMDWTARLIETLRQR